jgi:hypothetical protein
LNEQALRTGNLPFFTEVKGEKAKAAGTIGLSWLHGFTHFPFPPANSKPKVKFGAKG